MNAQLFGLILGATMLVSAVIAWRAAWLFLTDNREARRYNALVDEDRAHEIATTNEVLDLTVQYEASDIDSTIAKILDGGVR